MNHQAGSKMFKFAVNFIALLWISCSVVPIVWSDDSGGQSSLNDKIKAYMEAHPTAPNESSEDPSTEEDDNASKEALELFTAMNPNPAAPVITAAGGTIQPDGKTVVFGSREGHPEITILKATSDGGIEVAKVGLTEDSETGESKLVLINEEKAPEIEEDMDISATDSTGSSPPSAIQPSHTEIRGEGDATTTHLDGSVTTNDTAVDYYVSGNPSGDPNWAGFAATAGPAPVQGTTWIQSPIGSEKKTHFNFVPGNRKREL